MDWIEEEADRLWRAHGDNSGLDYLIYRVAMRSGETAYVIENGERPVDVVDTIDEAKARCEADDRGENPYLRDR